ncbi:MAG: hypothetical protein F6J87_15575 [Spirulina sp. SIO3F2]|nr:hypothetical protein [Spirulina sp. SIO3F2]
MRNDSNSINQQAIAFLGRTLMLTADEFSLILVRCNYQRLKRRTLTALQVWFEQQAPTEDVSWQVVYLTEQTTHLLSLLKTAHHQHPGQALMVMNLEEGANLAALLEGMNRDRDEFRKQLPIPVVLWLTDATFAELTRRALDFKTWGAASITIELSIQEALTLWWETVEYLFEQLLAAQTQAFIPNQALDLAPDGQRRRELETVRQQVKLTAVNQATWQFILGRDAYAVGDFDGAIAHFQRSLPIWSRQQGYWRRQPLTFKLPESIEITNPFVENKGFLLLHLGLCWARKAQQPGQTAAEHWQTAQDYLAASWEIFTLNKRAAIAAPVLLQLGQVLQQQQDWLTLKQLAHYALTLTPIQTQPTALAQVHGFLARVALAQKQYFACEQQTQAALALIAPAPEPHTQDWANILLMQADCQAQQNQTELALATLERIRQELVEYWHYCPPYSLLTKEQLYGKVLLQLRQFYFRQGQYQAAFERKQEYYQIMRCQGESQSLAAVGTITELGDGRQQAVQDFLERLSRSDHKLTILHGSSGVGKSQFLQTSLIPTLQHTILAAREVVPVLQNRYRDWEPNLCQQFQRALPRPLSHPVTDMTSLVEHLQRNDEHQLMTVLIWDQFEEFFVTCSQPKHRDRFYQFLQQVLRLPFVKIILTIRDDALHRLLTVEEQVDLENIDHNLLDRQIRYGLQNLSVAEAQRALQNWRTHLAAPFTPDLITAFGQDLADSEGCIRPLELQLLALQLQIQGVTTLEQYRQLGVNPKQALIVRALDTIVADCGPANQTTAWQVLLTLTHDHNTRLLRTRAELRQRLVNRMRQSLPTLDVDAQLDLILTVFVGSELVRPRHDGTECRYQLSHDYLVPTIRWLYRQRTDAAIAAEFAQSERRWHRARRQKRWAWVLGGVMTALAGSMALWAGQIYQQHQAVEQERRVAELQARSATAQVALVRGDRFTALLQALRAADQLHQQVRGTQTQFPLTTTAPIPSQVQLAVLGILEQALHSVWERNRFVGHQETVWEAVYAPDGQIIASVSNDHTVRLWSTQGEALATLEAEASLTSVVIRNRHDGYSVIASGLNGQLYEWQVSLEPTMSRLQRQWMAHEQAVYGLALSLDQTQLATASADGTIKLWTLAGERLQTLLGHTDEVQWLTFSPDGQLLASVSKDRTIKLWSTHTGQLQRTLTGHQESITGVAFNPDSQTLATVGHENQIYLWSRQGQLIRKWPGHRAASLTVQFSPDGQFLLTGSTDRTIKLWDLQGQLQQTLNSHRDQVTAVRFSPDGQHILSSSADKTVRLWQMEGQPRTQWDAHAGPVWSLEFDPRDGRLVSGSEDSTAKLWTLTGQLRRTFAGHQGAVTAVRFTPDGQTLATASVDQRIGLWQRNGQHQGWLTGHQDIVVDVQWHPQGQLLASGSRDRTVRLWSTMLGQNQSSQNPPQTAALMLHPSQTLQGHTARFNALAWSPDGRWLASAGDENLFLWPQTQGQLGEPRPLESPHEVVVALAFEQLNNPKRWLATASYDDLVQFWTPTGEVTHQMMNFSDSVTRLRFSPDGELMATLSWDHRLQLWHWQGELLQEWVNSDSPLTSLAWRADGGAIATGSEDGTVVLWNLELETLMAQGCQWLADYFAHHPRVTERDRAICAGDGKS